MLWDFPGTRFLFIFAWRGAVRNIVEQQGNKWNSVGGPVAAAMCHLLPIGAKWPAPFRIDVGDGIEIDILKTPPRQVQAVLKDLARVHIDRALIKRPAARRMWDAPAVEARYANGIDWDYIRTTLMTPGLTATAKRALQVLTAGGFWSDERRWMHGYAPTPECTICHEAVGGDAHFFRGDCGAVRDVLLWERIACRPCDTSELFEDPSLAPLTEMFLPPRVSKWLPIPAARMDGHLSMDVFTHGYGDGSGYRQREKDHRVATWAVVRLGNSGGRRGESAGRCRWILLDRASRRDLRAQRTPPTRFPWFHLCW